MRVGLVGTVVRPARPADIEECGRIWRDALNDYLARLNQPEVTDELAAIGRLHRHTRETDPNGFIVALRPDPARGTGRRTRPQRIVAFGSAVVRTDESSGRGLWFLSMLFVRPDAQSEGLGRALLERLLPGPGFEGSLATAIDSLQPISAALYSRYGIVPRLPLLNLAGTIRHRAALGRLPRGIAATRFDASDGQGVLDDLDRELLGVPHPADHAYLRRDAERGPRGFLYRDQTGAVAYGYADAAGRIGPLAARDASLLAPIVGHLCDEVTARGARSIWAPGAADQLVSSLLAAGLRIDEFPLLLCWDRPFADFSRYVPISPGLL